MGRAAARRAAILFSICFIIMCICPAASAAAGAPSFDLRATVSADGSARMEVRMTVHLDTPDENLSFPVPAGAYDILVNGVTPNTSRRGQVLELDLDRVVGAVAGDISLSITYTLPSVVGYGKSGDVLELNLPILCGFAHPIEGCTFTLILPGPVPVEPTLTSTYYQTRIEESLTLDTDGSQISGRLDKRIMGSDWLNLTLAVSEEMFPQRRPIVWVMDGPDLAMVLCGLLALVYWFLFLRCLPPRAIRRSTPPDGITAGELGSALTMWPADLTALVIQWAQMGYLIIQREDHGRVLLHKRMSMGNERSQYEGRIFRALFGAKTVIDGTGLHYAQLCRKVAAGKPRVQGLFQPGSGNPGIFRVLAALVGLFAGISHGAALGLNTPFQGVLTVVFGIGCTIAAWVIQEGFRALHLRDRTGLWISLGLAGIWLLVGLWVQEPIVGTCVVLFQLLSGLAAAYGGRRTELGKQALQQILGLRRWCMTADHAELVRIQKANPDYVHALAPYALALGADRELARRLGSMRLSACPYLTTGHDGHLTALEWSQRLRDVAQALDRRQKQLFWERLTGRR